MQWANKKINSKYGEHGFTAANKTHIQLLWKGNFLIQITTCLWFSYIYLTFHFTLQIAKIAPKTKNHTISLIRVTTKSLVAQWHCLVSFISRTRVQNWKPLLHLLYQLNCQPKKKQVWASHPTNLLITKGIHNPVPSEAYRAIFII